ncbi:response regulator [Paenibacillus psychroresistens]|uniref:Response regulator n=1 Tax=Paenibacillus psychroresistens TaxID=1778678 RepID=A0A6B8RJL5_9BACL|nr:response regulator [Paenibacillus psychroresistens]QGQ96047.1 response regulator [Paenibacillus psychroresistens]
MMLKILIVDDEFYFRKGFKVLLPFDELGFEICGEAKNGEEALQLIIELKPDIVFLDINMPMMDGLELAEAIRSRGLMTTIVFLTGYSEFSFAQQAMQLGVQYYLLKPVNVEELKLTLLSIKESIEKESSFKLEVDGLKAQIKESMTILKDRFVYELIKGNTILMDDEILQKLQYYKIDLVSSYYGAMILELDVQDKWSEEDKQLWRFAVANIAKEILTQNRIFVFQQDINEHVCMLLGIEEVFYVNDLANLIYVCEQIKQIVHKHLKLTVTIGLGHMYASIKNVSVSYKESFFAVRNKLTLGDNNVIAFSSVKEMQIMSNFYPMERRAEMLMNMRLGNAEELDVRIALIFKEFRMSSISLNMLFVICIEMASTCFELLTETGQNYPQFFREKMNLIEDLQAQKSLDEMEKWIKELFDSTMHTVAVNRSNKSQKIVQSVKKYIEENYGNENLMITEISQSLFINYGHLSYLFKKETGKTINDFLTEFRINKAKELMDKGNHYILEVSLKVGYSDQGYFSKCFKKFFGQAPSKYIHTIKNR